MNNANIIATNSKSLEVAAFMVAKTSGTINPIVLGMKIAMIENLRTRLAKGEIVEFDYVKKGASTSGTKVIRHAIGCLYGAIVAPRIKGNGVNNSVYGNQTYWDLERNAFRCFSYETIVKVY
jgi:hypothetical protein